MIDFVVDNVKYHSPIKNQLGIIQLLEDEIRSLKLREELIVGPCASILKKVSFNLLLQLLSVTPQIPTLSCHQ